MKKEDFYIFLEKCLELMTARQLERKAGIPKACITKHEKYIECIREYGTRKEGTYILPGHHFYKITLAVCRTLPVELKIGYASFWCSEQTLFICADGETGVPILESEFNALFK